MQDVIIIGGGPAGLTAALYCKRNGYNTMLIIDEPGGQMNHSNHIENYPGLGATTGMDIYEKMVAPIEEIIEYAKVVRLEHLDDLFILHTDADQTYTSKAIILATGCTPRTIKIRNVEWNKPYVHYCATCDGPLYKNQVVAVIGDGNSALEYARTLIDQGVSKVHLLALGDQLYGEADVIQAIKENPKIEVHYNYQLTDYFEGEDNAIVHLYDQNMSDLVVNGIFVAIGQIPNTQLLQGLDLNLEILDWQGYIYAPGGSTTMAGLFAAGDVVSGNTHQIVCAAASGVEAAMAVKKYFQHN